MLAQPRFKTLLIWLSAGLVAALSCSLYASATFFEGEYLPLGSDAFYHARRILDTVRDTGAFYEFDHKIHAPEGSLLVWPWGYDYLMSQIVRLGVWGGLSSEPMVILIWVPVAAVFISAGLLVMIARQLQLSHWFTALAALCFALAPTTQFLHGTGQIDHHFAEFIFVLGVLAVGLKWLDEPHNMRVAVALALTFGLAPAVHNGLFILQLPFLISILVRWFQGERIPQRAAVAFGVTLLTSTLCILVPSTAFREGLFEFYTLSSFHLYIAIATSATVLALASVGRTTRSTAILAVSAMVLLLPIASQITVAHSFVGGTSKWLEAIAEMKSPLDAAFTQHGAQTITKIYTLFIWLAPLTFLLCLAKCWNERRSPRLLFWLHCVGGLALLSAQVRMHYFGSFALYLPWLIVANDYTKIHPSRAKRVALATSLAVLVLYLPALRHQLVAPISTANDRSFEDTREMYSELQKACAREPGTVLADNNAGHYIRYYTECSVIINNFLLTPLHFRKMDEAERLFSLSAQQLPLVAPHVKYVLVRPLDIRRNDDATKGYRYWFFFPGTPRLLTDLLLGQVDALPPEYEMLHEIRFPEADNIPYARLFRIRDRHRSVVE